MGVVEDFATLFDGNHAAIGTEEGGCRRVEPIVGSWHHECDGHLQGANPIGVYPTVQRDKADGTDDRIWIVKWGCVDFDVKTKGKPSWDYEDEDEAHVAAMNLQKVLRALGATAWIERTRSYGRHVWVFADTWVSAATMRRALLVACGVAGVSSREVNPKQESLADGQLGNYVRLPYPGGGKPETRVVCGNGTLEGVLPVELFVLDAMNQRTSPDTLQKIADKYVEPCKTVVEIAPYVGDTGALRGLNPAGKAVFFDGPADGDRSKGMTYLAYQARLSGLTPSDAFGLLKRCTWNKFKDRRDEDKRLMETVERAWQ